MPVVTIRIFALTVRGALWKVTSFANGCLAPLVVDADLDESGASRYALGHVGAGAIADEALIRPGVGRDGRRR